MDICPCWFLAALCGAIGIVIGFILGAIVTPDDGPNDERFYHDDN
jgi:hypothetical protein